MIQDEVKLFDYGLFAATDCGQDVLFPVGYLEYLAPESLHSENVLSYSVRYLGLIN